MNSPVMHICGNVLTTENCSFFSLRCVMCQRIYSHHQWRYFLKHLVKCHPSPDDDVLEAETSDGEVQISKDVEYLSQGEYDESECNASNEEEMLEEIAVDTAPGVMYSPEVKTENFSDECDSEQPNGQDEDEVEEEHTLSEMEESDCDEHEEPSCTASTVNRPGRKSARNGCDPKAPTYTLFSSRHQAHIRRIRFHLLDNAIAVDFIGLVRDNPLLWDTTLPNFNRISERRSIMESWIPRFREAHNEEFTYDDFAMNLVELRRYYSKLLKRKPSNPAARKLLGLLDFMPPPTQKAKTKCDHCDKRFLSDTNYQGHLFRVHHIGETPFKCDECQKHFVNGGARMLHMKQVHLKQFDYACTLCDRSFVQPSNLQLHMAVHTGEKRFICETCGKGFRKRVNLTYHETRVHLRQRNFACDICPKAFYTKSLLKDHMNVHLNIRNFKCPECSKAFHSSHALMRHKQIHSTVKRYVCKMCDARFSQFVGLNAHMKSRHQYVQEKCVSDAGNEEPGDGDYDDPGSAPESIEVKRMDEYVYNFD